MEFLFSPHGGSTILALAASHIQVPWPLPPTGRLISVAWTYSYIMAAEAKKRKVDKEDRRFQERWKLQYSLLKEETIAFALFTKECRRC